MAYTGSSLMANTDSSEDLYWQIWWPTLTVPMTHTDSCDCLNWQLWWFTLTFLMASADSSGVYPESCTLTVLMAALAAFSLTVLTKVMAITDRRDSLKWQFWWPKLWQPTLTALMTYTDGSDGPYLHFWGPALTARMVIPPLSCCAAEN